MAAMNALKKTTSLSCLLLLVLAVGCYDSPTANRDSNLQPDASLGFKQHSEHLFSRPLDLSGLESESDETKFVKLEESGVEFNNYMARGITNMLLETGSGIALGDYDGDGLIDIYFTGSDVDNKLSLIHI